MFSKFYYIEFKYKKNGDWYEGSANLSKGLLVTWGEVIEGLEKRGNMKKNTCTITKTVSL